ncbi:hypothetical protein TcWFU_001951 [Taenia crassiceps]|uniref:Uncharacterized protein n=1 Tax=Taenia crassiceps TaxID=6207 RepID=A0ABR4QPC6_9CEST
MYLNYDETSQCSIQINIPGLKPDAEIKKSDFKNTAEMSVNSVVFQLVMVAAITFALPSTPKLFSVDKPMPPLSGDQSLIGEEFKGDGSPEPYLEYLKENFRRDRRHHIGFVDSDELYNAFPLPQPEFLG